MWAWHEQPQTVESHCNTWSSQQMILKTDDAWYGNQRWKTSPEGTKGVNKIKVYEKKPKKNHLSFLQYSVTTWGKKKSTWEKSIPSVLPLLRVNSTCTQPGIRPIPANPSGKVHLNSFPDWWSLKHIQLLCGAPSVSELANESISKNLPWSVHLTWLSCGLNFLWSKFKPKSNSWRKLLWKTGVDNEVSDKFIINENSK